ncbi:metal ABC transporter permease [Candidatus Peregrinibacteria bacterium]|nr:metal ABC transporter permease [Candidatus Peregrinibacteria bacterium]
MFEIFQYDFMIRAFIAGIAIAIVAPLIGTFLVVRRYSLIADTLAHVALLGVVTGFFLKLQPLFMALLTSIASSFGMEKLRHNKRLSGDSVLALFLSGSLAITSVLISAVHGFSVNLFSFLFGSISTVSSTDLYFIGGLVLLSLFFVVGFFKELFLVSVDDEIARASGIKTNFFNFLLIMLAALTVSLSIKIVGALLIGALMVIPVLAAIQFRRGFSQTIFIAILVSLFSVMSGLFLSYYLGWASGGTIVIIALIIFLFSLFLNKTE